MLKTVTRVGRTLVGAVPAFLITSPQTQTATTTRPEPKEDPDWPGCFNVPRTVTGLHEGIYGNFAQIEGGDVSNITGLITGCSGRISRGLSGNITDILGPLTGLTGDVGKAVDEKYKY